MFEEKFFKEEKEFREINIATIVEAIIEISRKRQGPVRILDLATGPNGFNAELIKRLDCLDYQLVLTDISPVHFKKGYDILKKIIPEKDFSRIRFMLADATNLSEESYSIPMWSASDVQHRTLNEVLSDTEYGFLHDSYPNGRRSESFCDESFDIVMGQIAFGSINTGDFKDAVKESIRVLKPGGYHIFREVQLTAINSKIPRTATAMKNAKRFYVRELLDMLGKSLTRKAVYHYVHVYHTEERIPEQALQDGDAVDNCVLVHRYS